MEKNKCMINTFNKHFKKYEMLSNIRCYISQSTGVNVGSFFFLPYIIIVRIQLPLNPVSDVLYSIYICYVLRYFQQRISCVTLMDLHIG